MQKCLFESTKYKYDRTYNFQASIISQIFHIAKNIALHIAMHIH